jgi:hypothetical protein
VDPKDQRLVQQSLNRALTQVSAIRQQMAQAKRTLQAKEQELRMEPRPASPAAPPAASPAPADPAADRDFMAQLTSALEKLTGGCDCPSLHTFDPSAPGARP